MVSSRSDERERGKGDKDRVLFMYGEFITDIGNAMNRSGEEVDGTYEGAHNAAGQFEGWGTYRFADGDVYEGEWKAGEREGRGTARFADGNVYEGEFKADKREGRGTYRYADGRVVVSCYAGGARVGEGAGWMADGQTVWRLQDGQPVEAISLEEATRIAASVGEPVPAAA